MSSLPTPAFRAPRRGAFRPACGRRRGKFLPARPLLAACALAFGAWFNGPALYAEVQIERTFLPHDASPSSFAIGLPGGVNFCFDPLRGAISYAWTGGFLDLAPVRPGPGKFIQAARLLGPVSYQETGAAPLRRGDPARPPVVEFTGYRLHDDRIEFRYTVDGIAVRQEVRATPDRSALLCRFRFDAAGDARWWHAVDGRPPQELKRETDGAFVLELPLVPPANK